MSLINHLRKIPLQIYVLHLMAAYILITTVVMITGDIEFYYIEFVATVPIGEMMACAVFLFTILIVMEAFFEMKGVPVFVSAVLHCVICVCIRTSDVYYTVCCIAGVGFLTYYLIRSDLLHFHVPISNKGLMAFILVEYGIVFGLTAYANVLRYKSYHSSTFDFGIFAQMYEYMAKTGLMGVSCERNEMSNHLLIHFSPIFYILLPFYMLFRTPSFLAAVQPMIVLSGVFPLVLICKKHDLSNEITAALSSVFLFYPTFTAACYYDFHENMFLTPILMWMMYFIECDDNQSKRKKGTILFTVLAAMIKEDAGLYLCCVGLYLIFYKRRKRAGAFMIFFGLTVFFAATSYINAFGDNTLSTQHYSNLIPPGQRGMFAALKTIVLDPGYLMTQLLSAEKVVFLMQMLLPLMLLPFLNRKLSQWFLALPLLAVSLITTYGYQFDIDYQYSFGTGALFVFMAVSNISNIKSAKCRKFILMMMVLASLLLMLNNNVPKYNYYCESYRNEQYNISLTDKVIDRMDESASVTASTFLVPKLYKHNEVYMLDHNCMESDYILIDTRRRDEHEQAERYYYEMGYTQVLEQGYIVMLKKPD